MLKLRGSISRDFTYNPDGDLEKISNCLGEKKFEYDEFSNLKKVTLPSGKVIEYKIDAFNRRVARLVNGVVDKYYMWYDQTHLAVTFDKDRNMQQYYIWGINKFAPAIIVDLTNGQRYKVHATLSGSIRHIVNYEGKVIEEIEYDELGMITKDTSPGFQPFGYNGGLWDPETQLVRFGARDYDPSVSRWTTKDPIGFNGGDTNLYAYVGGDPVNWVDPSGFARCTYSISTGRLSCTGNDGSSIGSANMFSGDNDPDSTGYHGGPIPIGKYDITKLPGSKARDWFLDPGLLSRIGYRMGMNRGGFNLHLRKGGSNGCITGDRGENDHNFNKINNILNQDAGINTLEVGF